MSKYKGMGVQELILNVETRDETIEDMLAELTKVIKERDELKEAAEKQHTFWSKRFYALQNLARKRWKRIDELTDERNQLENQLTVLNLKLNKAIK